MNRFKKAIALLVALSLAIAFSSGCADVTGPQGAGTSGRDTSAAATTVNTANSRDTAPAMTETAKETQPEPDTSSDAPDSSD
ncbi:MAG: hypothetical protein IKX86_07040, partial [Clostridia bacterium]|nr:hypothetical protein [Clostridia bacterium]